MTDGMKTSEFYITALVTGLAFFVSIGIIPVGSSDAIAEQGTEIIQAVFAAIMAISPAAYTVSRGLAKQG